MFKHMLSLLFSIFISLTASAQNNLEQYYSKINDAELAIVNGDLLSAQKFYQGAFLVKENPFAIDMFNAMKVSVNLKDWNNSTIYLKALANKGVGMEFFLRLNSLKEYRSKRKRSWKEIIRSAESTQKKLIAKNEAIINKLSTLYELDQKAHSLLVDAGEDYDKVEKYVKGIDDSLSMQLMEIFQEHGFLTEFNLGAFVSKDTIIIPEPNFYVIIRHNFQGRSSYDSLFANIVKAAVYNGTLQPIVYAGFRDSNPMNGDIFYGSSMVFSKFKCVLYCEVKKQEEDPYAHNYLEKINNTRKSLFLPVLENVMQKILFRIENPNSGYLFIDRYSNLYFNNKQSELSFLSRSTPIKEIKDCK